MSANSALVVMSRYRAKVCVKNSVAACGSARRWVGSLATTPAIAGTLFLGELFLRQLIDQFRARINQLDHQIEQGMSVIAKASDEFCILLGTQGWELRVE